MEKRFDKKELNSSILARLQNFLQITSDPFPTTTVAPTPHESKLISLRYNPIPHMFIGHLLFMRHGSRNMACIHDQIR